MPAGINHDDELDLSLTCMTLSEFKSQWMLVLQRGRVASQICHSTDRVQLTTARSQENATESDKVNGRSEITSGRLRKRSRLGRSYHFRGSNLEPAGIEDDGNKHSDKTTSDDPYDCYQRVTIPSSHDAVDAVVEDIIQQWRALDERKISASVLEGMQQPHATAVTNNKSLPKWYEKHVRLPDGFDYASIRNGPPRDDSEIGGNDRVVNFMDPTQTLSYHTELWKLFQSIPTRQQIEETLCHPHQLPNTDRWFRTNDGTGSEDGQGGGAIIQGTKSCSTTDWDFYGLSRFRLNDRHDLPPILPKRKQPPTNGEFNDDSDEYCGLIRLECLRKQLRRSSTPETNRIVLEFLGTQTLLHVHFAIVELTDDELWYDMAKKVPISSVLAGSVNHTDDTDDTGNGDEQNSSRGGDVATNTTNTSDLRQGPVEGQPPRTAVDAVDDVNDDLSSGYFFIENTFYTTGSVDYTTPIIRWLQSGTTREQKRRMEYLGIGPTVPTIKSMADTKLYDLPTRIGLRYVHVHHGDVECAIFFSDRRLMLQEHVKQIHQFPIIHDIWTSSYSIPECDICQTRAAVIATSTECDVTNGHAALCEACTRQLRLPQTSQPHLQRYTIWRGQSELSAGASNEVTW